ncbi:MAG: beta strand repeat-containing protein, partial [Simkaniaceae bacterium]
NIQTFTGGSAVDTFTFNGNFQLSGINGGGGTNSLTGPNVATAWTITGNNAGTINPGVGATLLTNIQSFTGGSAADTYTFNGNFQLSGINGGGGTNSVTGPNVATAWTVTGNNAGTINPGVGVTPLTNIQSFTGGSAADTFTFNGNFLLSGIDGGGGANSVTGPNVATAWMITGNNAGTINPGVGATPLTNIQTFTGGSAVDTFTFNGNFQLSGINGGGGANSVTGPNVATAWTVTGNNAGTINPGVGATPLTNIQTFTGGSAADTYTFNGNFQLSGINGGGGTNSITGPNVATAWTVTGNNAGTINPGGGATPLTNIQTFTGGSAADTFTFNGNFQLSGIDGGGGANSVTGPNVATTWVITSGTSGTINPGIGVTPLTNIQTFTGGSANDLFNLSADITIPTLQAGGGVNTLTFLAGWTIAAAIDLNTTTGFQVINGPSGLDNTLTGNNLANTWHITGTNSGTLQNTTFPLPTLFTFTNFPNLIGGSSSDSFIFDGNYQLNGTVGIDGSGGVNSVTGPNVVTGWTITGNNAGMINPGVGATLLTNIQTFNGGSATDTFTFSGNFQLSGINGGGGANSVTGPNVATGWMVTGNNAGTLNPGVGATPLTNIQTFTGGSAADTFTFNGNFQLSGGIDGGGGTNSLTGPNAFNTWNILTTTTGTLEPAGALGPTSFINIGVLKGGPGNDTFNLSPNILPPQVMAGGGTNTINFDPGWTIPVTIDLNLITGFQIINATAGLDNTLIGNNLPNTWHITADNGGTLENTIFPSPILFSFTNFPNIQGGNSSDVFTFDGTFQMTGSVGVNGGGGSNTINSPTIDTVWNVLSQTTGNLNPGGLDLTNYINIGTLNGSLANDTYNLSPNINPPFIHAGGGSNTLNFLAGWTTPVTINLNSIVAFQTIAAPPGLNNTLIGNNLANQWNITANNAGTLENAAYPFPMLFTFSDFPNLTGGNQNDLFIFSDGIMLSGQVNGGAPASGNTLDYSAFTTPVTITLTTPTSGTASNLGNGFINIAGFIGNYNCTNCSTKTQFSLVKAKGLRTDLLIALMKDIDYYEWNYDQIIFYNIYKTVLNSVFDSESLVRWHVEDRATPYLNHLFQASKDRLKNSRK